MRSFRFRINRFAVLPALFLCFSFPMTGGAYPLPEMDPTGYPAPDTGCPPGKCHAGIEPIRAHDLEMARQIYEKGAGLGDPNGCVVCHGGGSVRTAGGPKGACQRTARRPAKHLCAPFRFGLGQ